MRKEILLANLIILFNIIPLAFCSAESASLFLSPASNQYTLGQVFSVIVKINSGGQNINAADGLLSYNSDQLNVVNINKNGSVFNLWTTEPSFSNSSGEIRFGGGNPQNFLGNSGTLFTVTFKSKLAGAAKVIFSSGTILIADFKGTNILESLGGGNYNILPESIPLEDFIPSEYAPKAPMVTSASHPDSSKWYSNNNIKLKWELPNDVTDVSFLLNEKPSSNPGTESDGLITSKNYDKISDGVWYFHIRLKNKHGWGGVTHFKVQIDTAPPAPFAIEVQDGDRMTIPNPSLSFKAKDDNSGIDYYQIKVGEAEWDNLNDSKYVLSAQSPGKIIVIVRAYDLAGNSALAIKELEIIAIEAPVITDYPKELIAGSTLTISGKSLPDSDIHIFIKEEKEEKIYEGVVKSDEQGNFTYTHGQSLDKGVYQVWAQAIDNTEAKSNFSEQVTILVNAPVFVKIGKIVIDYLTVFATLIVFIWFIFFALLWIGRKIFKKKKRIKKEVAEAKKITYEAFNELKKKAEKQISILDGKTGLTSHEESVLSELKDSLKKAEKIIGKEIEDIDNEL